MELVAGHRRHRNPRPGDPTDVPAGEDLSVARAPAEVANVNTSRNALHRLGGTGGVRRYPDPGPRGLVEQRSAVLHRGGRESGPSSLGVLRPALHMVTVGDRFDLMPGTRTHRDRDAAHLCHSDTTSPTRPDALERRSAPSMIVALIEAA
ncbi:hypothetical protein [Pseudonocardia sp.]|jgi:hypothetical protein|uniref:hypothetical protein n=1 Tax=Pseudonocardia sp. TaxID=60912 RepID=UPI003D0DB7B9